jgi:hypothetical protein
MWEEMRNSHRKPKGRGHLGDLGREYIKIYFKGTGCEVVIWLHLAHNKVKWWALVNTVMSLRVS